MTSIYDNPDDLCICGHNFTSHERGPMEVFPGRFTHHIKEYRICCKKCDCKKFNKKKSRWEKFWDGPEYEQ